MAQTREEFAMAAQTLDRKNPAEIVNTAAALRHAAVVTRNPVTCYEIAKHFLDGVIFRPIGTRDRAHLYRLVALPIDDECTTSRRLDYAPPEYVRSFGRLNDIGQQILYACVDMPLILAESRIPAESHFGVLEYELREGEELFLPHLGITHSEFEQEAFSLGRAGITQTVQEFNLTEMAARNLDLIHALAAHFIKDISSDVYPATIALGKIMLEHIFPQADGLLYPSIFRRDSLNLALRPASADKKLKRTRAWRAIVLAAGDGKPYLHYESCSSSIDDEGRITWEAPTEQNLMPATRLA